ncbi:MAG: hypothetical protein KBS91_02480, partial [Firmicutes bacterium]|nr:hypothetical protein [Candidatus Caballimonas caccae]
VITCFITIKGEKGIIKGVLLGLFSAIILYFIFITFRINTFSLLSLVFEVIYLSIVGGICGIIAVNKKGV